MCVAAINSSTRPPESFSIVATHLSISAQFSRDAAAELADILAFVAQHSPSAAVRLRDALLRACVRLAAMPGLGHSRADLTSRPVKFWPVFSYLLVYDPTNHPLRIVAIIHAARDVRRVLRRR